MSLKLFLSMLGLTIGSGASANRLGAQEPPERGGVEMGLSMSWFPPWTVTSHYTDGAVGRRPFARQPLLGVTVAIFPHRNVGIRGRLETTGVRYYSEDTGFDVWRLGLEGRAVRFGPVTVVGHVDVGGLTQTNGISMRFWGGGAGVILRVSNAFVLSANADLLRSTAAGDRSFVVRRREIDLEPFAPRIGLTWRPLRFGF